MISSPVSVGLIALTGSISESIESLDDFLEGVIQEHIENPTARDKNGENFVDIMLEIYNGNTADGSSMGRDSMKALVVVIFFFSSMYINVFIPCFFSIIPCFHQEALIRYRQFSNG